MLARSPLHNPVRNFVSRVWYFLFSIWHLKISAVHLCWIDGSCVLIKRKYPCKLRIIWTHCLATKSYISYSNISLWPSCSYFSSECFQLFWEANRAVHRNWESVDCRISRHTCLHPAHPFIQDSLLFSIWNGHRMIFTTSGKLSWFTEKQQVRLTCFSQGRL